jgi:hypothetical protein
MFFNHLETVSENIEQNKPGTRCVPLFFLGTGGYDDTVQGGTPLGKAMAGSSACMRSHVVVPVRVAAGLLTGLRLNNPGILKTALFEPSTKEWLKWLKEQ